MRNNSPIWRDAKQVLMLVGQRVRVFPYHHKYPLGAELKQHVLRICILMNRVWCDKACTLEMGLKRRIIHSIVLHQGVSECTPQ